MTAAAVALSASCRKCLPIAASCGHRTKYGMFRSKWLMFTVSEGKLHMLIAFFIPSFPRKRESRDLHD